MIIKNTKIRFEANKQCSKVFLIALKHTNPLKQKHTYFLNDM